MEKSATNNAKDWVQEHRRQLMAAFAVVAVIVLIIGLCLSWFVFNKSLSTVGAVKAPADLKLMGPNQTAITEIDLTYDPQKDIDENGNVTLKKPFCVKSDRETSYSLMLAHTTNINGLRIELYKADAKANPSSSDTSAEVAGLDSAGKPFAWNKVGNNLFSQENYINKGAEDGKADTNHDGQTFGSSLDLDKLERSASPLYWKLGNLSINQNSPDDYIIELTWQESQKETDVLYLIASSQN